MHGDPNKPVLVLAPELQQKGLRKFRVRIVPSMPVDGRFVLRKLAPNRNAIRTEADTQVRTHASSDCSIFLLFTLICDNILCLFI